MWSATEGPFRPVREIWDGGAFHWFDEGGFSSRERFQPVWAASSHQCLAYLQTQLFYAPAGGPFSTRSWVAASLRDRKSTRLNSSHVAISYAVFCLKKK